VPTVDGGLGPCTADFTVTDLTTKPLYNAKIDVQIKHGFLGLRKTSLEVGTNSEGKARITGLPTKARKSALEFRVRYGGETRYRLHDPDMNCHIHFPVVFEQGQPVSTVVGTGHGDRQEKRAP
jgi:hypothetical protein